MADGFERRQSALIFDRIMQQCRDCLILVATSLKHQSAHAHQVGNVGDGDDFSGLLVMQSGRELQSNTKSPCQEGDVWLHAAIVTSATSLVAPVLRDCSIHMRGFIFPRTAWVRAPSASSDFGG